MSDPAKYFYGNPGNQQWRNVVSIFAAHNDLKSAKTSSLPLVQFWRDKGLTKRLHGIEPLKGIIEGARLCFEYAVAPKRGRGKASMTDLMIIGKNTVVAIEAKYTECAESYETVGEWNKENERNKSDVLRGWLEYIDEAIGGLEIDKKNPAEIQSVPYQLTHRIASACKVAMDKAAETSDGKAVNPMVVYQLFYDNASEASMNRFAEILHAAFARLKLTNKVSFHVVATRVTELPNNPPKRPNDLFLEMLDDDAYQFGESYIV